MGGMPCSPATLAPEAGGRRAAGTTERLGHELLAGDVRSGEPLKMTPCRSLLLDERLRSALEIRPSHAPRADRPRNEEGLFWRSRKRRRAPCGALRNWTLRALVGRTGFEPVTNGLKVRCSTS